MSSGKAKAFQLSIEEYACHLLPAPSKAWLCDLKKISAHVKDMVATLPSALAEFAKAGLQDPHLYHLEFLSIFLRDEGIESSVCYGKMDQDARNIHISKFRARNTMLLIVTNVAARGIDIPLLDNVINFDFPCKSKLFVHRVGRVARAGRTGTAYSFVTLANVESGLKSIGQDPSVSMINVLNPIRKALIGSKLLGHSDEIIEVSVVSCICEIMRISAPILPYDNAEMKVIFHHIIASLEKLSDILSDCYRKSVRVLEAIAKIRLCVMLLDLDYILAVNVFQLFLKTIRPYHPHAVSKYMEDIMTQLIEESDEVSIDFQVSILESLRKKTLDTAPLSSLLGHHVLEKCAARLKPCLLELIKTMNLNFDDYTDALGSVCREVPEGENTVENAGSVPPVEETCALQLPQVPQLDGTPTIMNDNNSLEPDESLKTLKHCNQAEELKDTDAPSDPLHKNTKDLEQQMNVIELSEKIRPDTGHDCFDMNESKSCAEEPTNKKEHEKKSGGSSDNAAPKESSSPSETGKQSMPDRPDVLAPNNENTHVNSGSSRKRGRPKKNQTEITVGKRSEGNSGSSRKRGRPKKNQTELTVRKRSEGTSSPSLTVSIKKEKETVSDAENTSLQQNDLQNRSRRTKHSRKQALNKEKDSKRVHFIKDYGEELIGAKVRVWWPLDRKFYVGVISSFDTEIKKHKVKYTDGEEEILNLNHERWELLEEVSVKEEPVTDFPPELSLVSGKKAQESDSTPGKNIQSEKAPTEDNSRLLSHNSKNIVIKEEVEDESTVPSNALSEEPATDFLPEVSAMSGKKAHGSGSKPR
nr:sister chromatid cohesion protein PDS5-like [Ipomoea batatas]